MLQLKNYKEVLLAQVLEVGSSDLYVSPDSDYPPVPFIIEWTEGYTLFDLRNSERVLCYEEVDSGHFKAARNWDNNYSYEGPSGTCADVNTGNLIVVNSGSGLAIGHGLRFLTHRQLYRVIDIVGTTITLDPPVQGATGTSWYVCTKDYDVSQEREHGITEYGLITPGFANFEELQDGLVNLRFPDDIYGHSLTLADAATVTAEGTIRYHDGAFEGKLPSGWAQLNNIAGAGWTPPTGADGEMLVYQGGDLVATDALTFDAEDEIITAAWPLAGGQISATTFMSGDLSLTDGLIYHAGDLVIQANSDLTLKGVLTLNGATTFTTLTFFDSYQYYRGQNGPPAVVRAGVMYFDPFHGFRYYIGNEGEDGHWVNMGADGTELPVGSVPWSTLHYHPSSGWEVTDQLLVSDIQAKVKNSLTLGTKAPTQALEAGLIEFVNNDFQGIVRFGNSYRRVSFTSGVLAANTLPTGTVENALLAYNGEFWEERPALLAFPTYLQIPQLKLGVESGDEGKVQYDADNKVLTYHNGTGWAPIDGGGGGGGLVPIPTADSKMLFSQGGAWVEASSITFDDLTISVPALTTPALTATDATITNLEVTALQTESLSLSELILPEDATLTVGTLNLGTAQLTNGEGALLIRLDSLYAGGFARDTEELRVIATTASAGTTSVTLTVGIGASLRGRTFTHSGVDYFVLAQVGASVYLNQQLAQTITAGTTLTFGALATLSTPNLMAPVAAIPYVSADRVLLQQQPLLPDEEGAIRYNGDFQGCLQDENGDLVWSSFTLSLADGQMDAANYGSLLAWDGTQWVYNVAGLSSEGALRLAHAPNAGAVEGALRFNATTHEFEACADTGTWITLGTGGGGGSGSVPVGTVEDSSLRWNGAAWVEATTVKINPYYVHAPLFKMPEYATIVAPPLPVGGMVRYNQNDYEGFMTGIGWVSFTGRQDVLPKPEGDPLLSAGNIVYFNGIQWVADHDAFDLENVFYLRKHFAPDSLSCDLATVNQLQMYTATLPETAPEGRVLFDGAGFKGRVGEEWVSLASVIREVDAVAGQTLVRGADALWYNTDALTITDAVTVNLDTLWLDNWAFKSEVGYLEGTEAWRLALNHRVDVEGSWVVTEYEYARTNPDIRVSKLSHLMPKLYVGTADFEELKEGEWEQTELLVVDGTMRIEGTLTGAAIAADALAVSGDIASATLTLSGLASLAAVEAASLTTSGEVYSGSYIRVGYTNTQPPRGSMRYSTPGNASVGDWEGWDGEQWVSLTGGFYGQPISGTAITDGVVAYDGSDYRSFASLLVTDDAIEAVEPVTLADLNVKAPGGTLAAVRYTGTDLQTSFDGGANWLSLVTQPDTDTLPLQLPPNGLYKFSRPAAGAPEIATGTCYATARGSKTMIVSTTTAPSVGQIFQIDGTETQAEMAGHTVETVDTDGTDHEITFSIPLFYDVEAGAGIHFRDPGDGQWQYDTSLRLGDRVACARVFSLDPWETLEVKPTVLQGGYLRFAGNDFQGYIAGRGWVSLTEQASVSLPHGDGELLVAEGDRWVHAAGLSYIANIFQAPHLAGERHYVQDSFGSQGYVYLNSNSLMWQPPTGMPQTLFTPGTTRKLTYYTSTTALGASATFGFSSDGLTLEGGTFSGGLKTNSLAASASYIPVVSPITFQGAATFEAAILSSAAITTSSTLSAGATQVASLASTGALSGTTLNLSGQLTASGSTALFNIVQANSITLQNGLIAASLTSSEFGRQQQGSFGTLVLAEELTPVAGSVRYTGTVFAPSGEWAGEEGSGFWYVSFHCGEVGVEAGDFIQSDNGIQEISVANFYTNISIGGVTADGYTVQVPNAPSGNLLVRYKHGDFQGYDGSNWVSFTGYDDTYGTIGGGSVDVPDFNIVDPANNQILQYASGVWENTADATLDRLCIATPAAGFTIPSNALALSRSIYGQSYITARTNGAWGTLSIQGSTLSLLTNGVASLLLDAATGFRVQVPNTSGSTSAFNLTAVAGDAQTEGTYWTSASTARKYQASLPQTLTNGALLYFDLATTRWLPASYIEYTPAKTTISHALDVGGKLSISSLLNVAGCKRTVFEGTYSEGDAVFDADYNMYIALTTGTYTGQTGFFGKLAIEPSQPPVTPS
jgi:hypothetical protein